MQDANFMGLVTSFYFACWQQLGKTANPMTGKAESNLEQAKYSIDVLIMLKEKTKGNLTDEEKKVMEEIIANLQLNYVDERKRSAVTEKDKDKKETEKKDEGGEKKDQKVKDAKEAEKAPDEKKKNDKDPGQAPEEEKKGE